MFGRILVIDSKLRAAFRQTLRSAVLAQSHRETPISESAGLVEKQAHLRWFKVKAELGRLGSPVTIFREALKASQHIWQGMIWSIALGRH
jgi:hypothetical protein